MSWWPFALSKYGGFPRWLSGYPFAFRIESIAAATPIARLEFTPYGFEFNRSHGMYGVYFTGNLEGERDYPGFGYPFGDFLDPIQIRKLVSLISGPSPELTKVSLSGEVVKLAFSWQDDRRLRIEGLIGTEDWGNKRYLEERLRTYPFQPNLRFKCSASEISLQDTLTDLENLLQVLDEIEANTRRNWPPFDCE